MRPRLRLVVSRGAACLCECVRVFLSPFSRTSSPGTDTHGVKLNCVLPDWLWGARRRAFVLAGLKEEEEEEAEASTNFKCRVCRTDRPRASGRELRIFHYFSSASFPPLVTLVTPLPTRRTDQIRFFKPTFIGVEVPVNVLRLFYRNLMIERRKM